MAISEKSIGFLRMYNWIFTIACFLGVMIIMFQSTATGMQYLLIFSLMFIVSYPLSAILLYPGESRILGLKIPMDKENKFVYSISIGFNVLFASIGGIIIFYAFLQGMFVISFLGLLFLLLSYFNVKALKARLQELSE